MSEMIAPPWTAEQVAALETWQRASSVHPFTCPNRGDGKHFFEPEYHDTGALRPGPHGWWCPYCPYDQKWAHDFMFEAPPKVNWP